MGDSTEKQPENKGYTCTDIPLAVDATSKDTKLYMQLAKSLVPELDFLRQSMESIAAAETGYRGEWSRYIFFPVRSIKILFGLCANARAMERLARESDSSWQEMLAHIRSGDKTFSFGSAMRKDVLARCSDVESDLTSILSRLTTISEDYPRLAGRIKTAVERLRVVQCRYIPLIVKDDDAQMIASADRHYAEGTLMDIETFANGLLRH